MHHVVEKRDKNLLKFFLEERANLEIVDNNKNTALITAVVCKNVDAVKILLDNGAAITKQNIKGQTCFDLAIENGLGEIATVIVKHDRYDLRRILIIVRARNCKETPAKVTPQ